ncbi:hypothetical protein [Priestia sp. TGN 0903]|uniref:hypothetical protein n=1 Tax=Priestia sp. TGN 0903 TaxID=3420730 RepID=UPI003D778457
MRLTTTIYKFEQDLVKNLNELKSNRYKKDENFRITSDIWFRDAIWDFKNLNKLNRSPEIYRYDFNKIPSAYHLYVKTVILNQLLINKNRFSSIHPTFSTLKSIIKYLEHKNIHDIRLLDLKIIKDFFEEKKAYCTNNYIETLKLAYYKLITAIEDIDSIDVKPIKKYLDEITKECYKAKTTTAKNQYIPNAFLNQIVSIALSDIENFNLNKDRRIVAALIILLAETGMRLEEATMLEANNLEEIVVGENRHYYLKFRTFKIQEGTFESKETVTWLSDKAVKAYKVAENLVNEIIDSLSESTKNRVMLTLRNKGTLKPKSNNSKIKSLDRDIDIEELKMLDKQARKYLFISEKYGLKKHGTRLLRDDIQRFFFTHEQDFNIDKVPSAEIHNLKMFKITSESKYNKFVNVEERKKVTYKEIQMKKYWYVNPHMFRVTVCTKLFLQGVHLDFIVKHMNHLSEDMTTYYDKSEEFQDKLNESVQILSSISNENGLIETNPLKVQDSFLQSELHNEGFADNIKKINEFLTNNDLNIQKDMEKVLKLLKRTQSPLAENEFGVCMRSVIHGICERRKYFSSSADYYHIGVQLPTFKFIRYSYERFKQKKQIVEHNKIIATKNDKFISEYEREVNALKHFSKKTLKTEIKLLEKYIKEKGKAATIEEFPDTVHIVNQLESIKEEVQPWIK